ncbi:MAG: gamma-glutamylcyclotransferase family protein [Candidatus Altiarchaeota archaeon]
MRVFYFAYGSNMDKNRMVNRGVKIFSEDIAVVKGWKLVFNKRATSDKGVGYANIIPDKNSEVYGVIYEIEEADILKLDNYEGYPNHYNRQLIPVLILKNKKEVKAQVYIAQKNMTDDSLKPSSGYMKYLIDGAKQHNFPLKYIEFLERIEVIG